MNQIQATVSKSCWPKFIFKQKYLKSIAQSILNYCEQIHKTKINNHSKKTTIMKSLNKEESTGLLIQPILYFIVYLIYHVKHISDMINLIKVIFPSFI